MLTVWNFWKSFCGFAGIVVLFIILALVAEWLHEAFSNWRYVRKCRANQRCESCGGSGFTLLVKNEDNRDFAPKS